MMKTSTFKSQIDSYEQVEQTVKEEVIGKVRAEHTDDDHFYRYLPEDELYPSMTTVAEVIEYGGNLKEWAVRLALDYVDDQISDGSYTGNDWDKTLKAAQAQHRDRFKDAGDVGTKGHEVIENFLADVIVTGRKPAEITNYIKHDDSRLYAIARSAKQFLDDFDVVPVYPELKVATPRHELAGTLDLLAFVGFEVESPNTSRCDNCNLWLESENNRRFECSNCGRQIEYKLTLVDWKTSNRVDKDDYAMQVSGYKYALRHMCDIRVEETIIVKLNKDRQRYKVVKPTHTWDAFRTLLKARDIWQWYNDGSDKLEKLNKKEKVSLFGDDKQEEGDTTNSGFTEIT